MLKFIKDTNLSILLWCRIERKSILRDSQLIRSHYRFAIIDSLALYFILYHTCEIISSWPEIEKLVERKGLRFEDRRLVCRLNSRFNYRSGIDNGYDHAMRLTGGQESRESGGDRVEAATVAQFAKDPLLSPIFESR